ncbi:MAG: peptidoglycan-binding protein [Synechococcales cyanobacterium C42_A2020_086]|jgi:hypothetical protein|nr:peptidoglycan-binding protein [Synechococcales cyanobacterium C42_A2020_086]
METVAYVQLTQEYEHPELKELSFSSKTATSFLGVAGTLSVLGLVDAAPAVAHYYGGYHGGCCRPVYYKPIYYRPCCRPVYYQPIYYSSHYYPDYYYSKPDYHHYKHHKPKDHYIEVSSHYPHKHDPVPQRPALDPDLVAALQQALLERGYDPGPIDGIYGPLTTDAVTRFQIEAGIQVDGIAGPQTLGLLGLA